MLNDNDTYLYIKIKKDPIKKLTSDIRSMLTRWRSKGFINNGTYSGIYCSDGNLPRAYGSKIHKSGLTFRLIISSIDSPTYALAKYLQKIISKNTVKPPSHIDNSFDLVKKLNGTPINNEFDLVSLDVVSLFTNVPLNLKVYVIDGTILKEELKFRRMSLLMLLN